MAGVFYFNSRHREQVEAKQCVVQKRKDMHEKRNILESENDRYFNKMYKDQNGKYIGWRD